MGGGLAGTRDRDPVLAPAGTPLAWPLVPTGGDALRVCTISKREYKEKRKKTLILICVVGGDTL